MGGRSTGVLRGDSLHVRRDCTVAQSLLDDTMDFEVWFERNQVYVAAEPDQG
jgi:hypothetical protein